MVLLVMSDKTRPA